MISIKSDREIELMKKAGNIVFKTHNHLKSFIKPGVTTNKLNDIAEKFIIEQQASPSFKNYNGFPKSICISINDEVVHGIPSERLLKEGDIVSIDIGANYKGYHSDSAWTYPVGKISYDKEFLLKETKEALYEGIRKIHSGIRIGDISNAIEGHANKHELSIVRELVGHGVGNKIHEDPDIPNYGKPNTGPLLKAGMVIAIEPMLNLGTKDICIKDDNWTIVTSDGSPSAHFEHTVLVTDNGYEILTGE